MFKKKIQAERCYSVVKEKLRIYWGYLIILISILLIVSLIKNVVRISEIRKSIEEERARLTKLQEENDRLKRQEAEVTSGEFIEKQLRDKLGLAKPGEIVLVLPDEDTLRKLAPVIPQEQDSLPDPNWKKWLQRFMSK